MKAILTLVLLLLVSLTPLSAQHKESDAFDIVVEQGRVIDGTGSHAYVADVGVRNGVIASIGNLSGSPRNRTISARGKIVAPGFIDMLVGSSIPLLLDAESADSKLFQGVTTIVVGEGDSMAPQSEQTLLDFPASNHLPAWHNFTEYFQLLEARGLALNVVHNVGAAQVRRVVLGDANVQPNRDQLDRMTVICDLHSQTQQKH